MNATNSELLAELVATVRRLPGSDPDSRRAALLAPGPTGRSIIDGFRARQVVDEPPVSGPAWPPDQLLDARHDGRDSSS
jgi:hypothetical protein